MTLFADADRQAANLDLLLWGGALVGVLLIGAAIVAKVDRWRKRMLGPGPAAVDNLAAFRVSYEQGDLTEDEFRKIRSRLMADKTNPPTRTPKSP